MFAPETPLSPAAWTIDAPGVVDTEFRTVGPVLALGLGTVTHAVPFQFRVRVCAVVEPGGWSTPTAHTLFDALRVVTPVRLAPVPGEGQVQGGAGPKMRPRLGARQRPVACRRTWCDRGQLAGARISPVPGLMAWMVTL